jgi:hypothetical protein
MEALGTGAVTCPERLKVNKCDEEGNMVREIPLPIKKSLELKALRIAPGFT